MARFRTSGTAWDGQPWKLAPALVQFAKQIEALRPTNHATDGTVAGKTHDQNSPNSDHTVWPKTGSGVVYAIDVGDSEGTVGDFVEALRTSRDPRIKYVIHNRRIFSSYATSVRKAWQWGSYSGYNAHLSHMHLSVHHDGKFSADPKPWVLGSGQIPTPGEDVETIKAIQAALNKAGVRDHEGKVLTVDGKWGARTEAAFINGLKLGATGGTVDSVARTQSAEALAKLAKMKAVL